MRRMYSRGLVAAMEQEEVVDQAQAEAAAADAAAVAVPAEGERPAAAAEEGAAAPVEAAAEEVAAVAEVAAEVPAADAPAAEAAPEAAVAEEAPAAEVPAADPASVAEVPAVVEAVAAAVAADAEPAAVVEVVEAAVQAAAEAPSGEAAAAAGEAAQAAAATVAPEAEAAPAPAEAARPAEAEAAAEIPPADGVVEEVQAEATDEAPAADSLETDLIDIVEGEGDAAEANVETDQAVEVAGALDDIAVALESAAGNGGMNKDAALAMDIALTHMYKSVGLKTGRVMPALESFGGTSSRVAATTLAMEDVKEKAKEIWRHIVNAVKKSIAWLKQRFELVFGAAGKLKARAEALGKAAEAAKGAPAAATIENERLVGALYMNGKVDGVAAADILKAMSGEVLKPDAKIADALASVLEAGKLNGMKDLLGSLEGGLGVVTDVQNPASQGLAVPASKNLKVQRSRALPGGKAIIVHAADVAEVSKAGIEEQVAAVSGTTVTVGQGWPKVAGPSSADLKTLAPADVQKIAADVAAVAAEVQGYKVGLAKASSAKDKIVAALEKLSNSTDENPEVVREHKLLAKLGSSASRLIDVPVAGYSVYALNTAKALLDYSELSLKQYGAKAAAPAAAAA